MIKKSTDVYLFSSPLQYFFCLLLGGKSENNSIGYYYQFGKDFVNVYNEIETLMGVDMPISSIDTFNEDELSNISRLFFSNRFSEIEINFFIKYSNVFDEIHYYEEGYAIYLPHMYGDNRIHDTNPKLIFKNYIKRLFSYLPQFIPLKKIHKFHSVFPIDHLPPESVWSKIQFPPSCNNEEYTPNVNKILFLSQWLVNDGLLNEDEYIGFLCGVEKFLSKTYSEILYKPHPRDSIELTAKVFEICKIFQPLPVNYNEAPVELYLFDNKNISIIGFTSSTLIYASGLFNIPTFSLSNSIVQQFPKNKKLSMTMSSLNSFFDKLGVEQVFI